jgi:DNA-directed RNA polymerase specialized sigma24 family protein
MSRMAFPTTSWSLLAQATINGRNLGRDALGEFYCQYRAPLVRFVARRPEDRARAEDLVQAFFVHLIEHSTLQRADRVRGRFRSFLLGALVRFLAQEREHEGAAKRGGGVATVDLESLSDDDASLVTLPETTRVFDLEWSRGLLARAQLVVESSWVERGLVAQYQVVRDFLPGALITPSYQEAADQLGWTLARLKTEVSRARELLRDTIRAEVALTVEAPHEVDAEIAYLHAVLANRGTL